LTVSAWRALAIYGALSFIAVGVGCAVGQVSGVPTGVWARNLGSWLAGGLAAALIVRFARPKTWLVFALAAPLGLLASLFNSGQLGVHRWLDVGPLRMNAAQVLLPAAIAACGAPNLGRIWPWAAASSLVLLVFQPDASQAMALGGALFALIGASSLSRPVRAGAMAAVGLAMAASWLRPDPLAPVAEVEEIMRLAAELSPLAAVGAWGALIAALGSPALMKTPGDRGASRALCAYAVLSALVPLIGPFPVPLVGMAMSPILGLWLGVGLLVSRARNAAVSKNTPAASGD